MSNPMCIKIFDESCRKLVGTGMGANGAAWIVYLSFEESSTLNQIFPNFLWLQSSMEFFHSPAV